MSKSNDDTKQTKRDIAKEIESLLEQLQTCLSQKRKKSIRRKLRARGHRGGLNGQVSDAMANHIARTSNVVVEPDGDGVVNG